MELLCDWQCCNDTTRSRFCAWHLIDGIGVRAKVVTARSALVDYSMSVRSVSLWRFLQGVHLCLRPARGQRGISISRGSRACHQRSRLESGG